MTYDLPEFPPMVNERLLKRIRGLEIDQVPVWIMRQAGRYLPEFRELRKKYNFFQLCSNPTLACEVTLMPIKRFHLDAAIIFSDILVVPQALGMEVLMNPVSYVHLYLSAPRDLEQGPSFPAPLTLETVGQLQSKGVIDRLKYVGEAITLTRKELKGEAVLIGFSGAPWTLMSYMIEGGGSKTYSNAKKWLYAHKKEAHDLLALLVNVVSDYCIMQAKAGAQVIQIFDTNAEYLSKDLYSEFCIAGLRFIREKVRLSLQACGLDVPMIMFAKGLSHCYKEIADMGYEVIGLDWCTEPAHVIAEIAPRDVCFQGNLDPCALYTCPKDIHKMVNDMLDKFKGSRVIANLGHGIYPDTPIESVYAFVDAVRTYGKPPTMFGQPLPGPSS